MSHVSNLLIYVAGPLTAWNEDRSHNAFRWSENVRRAELVWLALQDAGFAAICVHANARHMFGRVPEPHALAADLLILERCDAVVLVEGWQKSSGTLGEIKHARALHKPVFETVAEAVEWRAVKQAIDTTPDELPERDDVFGPSGILHCGTLPSDKEQK